MLASAHYTAGAAFQQEKRAVFSSAWLPIGVTGQLAEVGSFVSATIGGWPLFAARGSDGALRAFRNTCRHKGMMVVEQAAGRCEAFRCRYHGWTYGLDGGFREAPTPVAPPDPESAAHHLEAASVECWRAAIFANLAPGAAPGDYTDIEGAVASHGGLGEYAASITADIACNWKVCLEHALADHAVAWQWPLITVRTGADATVIEQIVPRTFLRTRAVSHVFLRGGVRGTVEAREKSRSEEFRAACEALQAARAGGSLAASDEPRTARLHQRLLQAYATSAD